MMMNTGSYNEEYRNRRRVTRIAGALLFVAGIAFVLLAMLETQCFSFFSDGGRFHYEGFGFGSFMFANITVQVVVYFLTGALLAFIGYGHFRFRRWSAQLSRCLMWAWLFIGLPVIAMVYFLLLASKEVTPAAAVLALVVLGLSYFVLPGLVIRYFGSPKAGRFYEAADPGTRWTDRIPARIAVLSILYSFCVFGLLVLLLLKGIFPVFGTFVYGTGGIVLIAVTTLFFVLLIWGTLRQRIWAWWGACLLLGLLTVSAVSAFLCTGYSAVLAGLSFPPSEMQFLAAIPAQGWHLAVLAAIPLLSILSAAALSKRFFGNRREPA